ncbi:MAG: type I restriction-modification system subunit M, partial [Paludibacter sp.]|nr:type I restriction-modification system subunit M [Paludibacter sp.]
MAIKKSELYSTLWKSCDELRGGMDASQYKDYVLVVLFVKYVSDKYKNDPDSLIEIPEGCGFDDFVALKGKSNIGEEINKKMAALAEANDLSGVINVADFCDEQKLGKGKDLVDTVSNLIGVFQSSGLDFGKNRANDDDLMGDAYEYLMKHFASESGKSKGQFYTPAEVSRVMAKVIGLQNTNSKKTTIYDPACGSGSLLLRALSETPHGATLYGQEKDSATVGLAKMNMILHGEELADIRQGDTINNPQFKSADDSSALATYDFVVANPPFSTKSWLKSAKEEDEFGRWNSTIGVPPEKNGDYAFLLHIIRSLNRNGQGACILPHGVLFRGNAEATIRKYIVEKGYIKGIIGLPANLFYGTGIPACIIVLDKKDAANRKGIFMIDAKAGYAKDGPKNRLREQDVRRIVDVWHAHKPVAHFARFVEKEEIVRNDYNLNLPRYIESEDAEILQDI